MVPPCGAQDTGAPSGPRGLVSAAQTSRLLLSAPGFPGEKDELEKLCGGSPLAQRDQNTILKPLSSPAALTCSPRAVQRAGSRGQDVAARHTDVRTERTL